MPESWTSSCWGSQESWPDKVDSRQLAVRLHSAQHGCRLTFVFPDQERQGWTQILQNLHC
jgi:hypothetical protein